MIIFLGILALVYPMIFGFFMRLGNEGAEELLSWIEEKRMERKE